MKKKPKLKKISRNHLANLSVILGQMTFCRTAVLKGIKIKFVEKRVFESWEKSIKEIIEEGI